MHEFSHAFFYLLSPVPLKQWLLLFAATTRSNERMPAPSKRTIPPEAGYPGLPIDDAEPEGSKAKEYLQNEVQPRKEFDPDTVGALFFKNRTAFC